MQLPWVEKYRPKSRDDLVGNEIAINGLFLFLKNWNPSSKHHGALLIGPAGCGKTSAVHAIANDLNYEVIELNASDTRKKSSIKTIVGPTAQYQSLENPNKKRIILMDEVDGISGRYDRGGLTEFIKIVKSSSYPVICTANDPESDKLTKLRKLLRVFEYRRLDEFEIFELLLSITNSEQITIDDVVLEQIASKAAGDIRAAINELESHSYGTAAVQLEERNKMVTLVEMFNELFRAKNYREARKVMNNAPSDYYKLLLFLFDETADQCKTPEELATAYEQLAQADIVYNRIMRTQDWSLLKYFFSFIGPGIALARPSNYYKKINSLSNIPTSFISRGMAKRINSKAMNIAPVVAPKLHISETKFINEEFDLFSKIILGSSDLYRREHEDDETYMERKNTHLRKGAQIAAWLGLDDDQLEQLSRIDRNSPLMDHIDEARRVVGRKHLETSRNQEVDEKFALDPFLNKHISSVEDDISSEQGETIGQELDESTGDTGTEDEETSDDPDKMTLDDFF